MNRCFDRFNERKYFENTEKKVIFFVNSQGNGMSTFLYNILENKQYIFLRENTNSDIVFDFGNKQINEYEKTRLSFIDMEVENLQNLKSFLNLFYLVNTGGSFLRNVGIDLTDKVIKECNKNKYFFESFLNDYLLENKNKLDVNDIYLIVEHADFSTKSFLYKLKGISQNYNIKLVFCLHSPIIRAEFKNIFDDYLEIDFSKPTFENAKIIFDNLNMEKGFYSKKMYLSSNNLFEFISKYQLNKKNNTIVLDPLEYTLISFLSKIPCTYSKYEFDILCDYLESNALTNQKINREYYFDLFIQKGIISNHSHLYVTTQSFKSNVELDDHFNSFTSFALSKYKNLLYDFLYFMYQVNKKNINKTITDEIILHLIEKSENNTIILELIGYFKRTSNNYFNYLKLCKILFKNNLYEFLYEYDKLIPLENVEFQNLLNLMISDKKHMGFNEKSFKTQINECLNKYNKIDLQCLIVIIYLDYCINHNKKEMKRFFDERNIFYFQNYINSKYFYILESIIAYYSKETEAIDMYEHSIKIASNEKIYIYNNQFAFYLSKYANTGNYIDKTKKLYQNLIDNYKWIKDNQFFNTNILLFESLINNQNLYKFRTENDEKLETWDLYKLLNGAILDFSFSDNFYIKNYLYLEKKVKDSNRAPAKNIFYYNLYIIARCINDKGLLQVSKKYLKNNVDFKKSNIYSSYKKLESLNDKDIKYNKIKYVRFGYIFSRLSKIHYLFDEIALFNKQ